MSEPNDLIEVAIPLPISGPFTYKVPEQFLDRVEIGRRVLVPFRNKVRAGFIVAQGNSGQYSEEKIGRAHV